MALKSVCGSLAGGGQNAIASRAFGGIETVIGNGHESFKGDLGRLA
jgi:hypothetical protein